MTTATAREPWTVYSHAEARTRDGQVVHFTCQREMAEQLKATLGEHVGEIDIARTGQVNVEHGGYGRYTRYKIKQHKYAGGDGEGGGGYIEVLEITDAPDGRCGFVVHEYHSGRGSSFTEWRTLKDSLAAWQKGWSGGSTTEVFAKATGFIRRVHCNLLNPWFYAVGRQVLVGDYAFPEGLQDDPVYTIGRRFVVADDRGLPCVRVCMGSRFIDRTEEVSGGWHSERKKRAYRIVVWDDGTAWDESGSNTWWRAVPLRALGENELWIAEALVQFQHVLSGGAERVEIKFADGSKFIGRRKAPKGKRHCAEGDYFVRVLYQGKRKPQEGWLAFKPTTSASNVVDLVIQGARERDCPPVKRVEVVKTRAQAGGKKWLGVYHIPAV